MADFIFYNVLYSLFLLEFGKQNINIALQLEITLQILDWQSLS
mgnify:FL=1